MKVHQHILYLNGEKQDAVLRVGALGCEEPGGDVWAVDGGLRHVPMPVRQDGKFGFIGDTDSVGQGFLAGRLPKSVSILAPDKDFSDFAGALDQLKGTIDSEEGVRLDVFCGLGGRRDHEWVNVAEMAQWVGLMRGRAIGVFHPGVIVAACPFKWHCDVGTVFTLASPSGVAETVRVEGGQWSGNIVLDRPSKGLSNVALESTVTIRPERGAVVVLMLGGLD